MSILSTGWLLNALRPTITHTTCQALCPVLFIQSRDYAARKGTRARKDAIVKANKLRNLAAKAKLDAARQQVKNLRQSKQKNALVYKDDSLKADIPSEQVYVSKYYKWQVFPFEDAIESHREMLAPDMLNVPNAHVSAIIDLNLQGRKKTRTIEKIERVAVVQHVFPQKNEKSIVFFTDDEEQQKVAVAAGADVAAGTDLLRQIQTGAHSLEEYDYFLAHPDILPQLLLLKGIFKHRLPSQLAGTLSSDVDTLVHKFKHGIHYKLQKSTITPEYGLIQAEIGTLDMDVKHLAENFTALLTDMMEVRPKRPGPFILRTRLACPPSAEQLVVDYKLHVKDPYLSTAAPVDADDDEEETRGVIESV